MRRKILCSVELKKFSEQSSTLLEVLQTSSRRCVRLATRTSSGCRFLPAFHRGFRREKETSLRRSVKTSLRPKASLQPESCRIFRAEFGASRLTFRRPIKEGTIFALPPQARQRVLLLPQPSSSSLSPPLLTTPIDGRRPLNGGRAVFSRCRLASMAPRRWLGEVAQRAHSESYTIRGRTLEAPCHVSSIAFIPSENPVGSAACVESWEKRVLTSSGTQSLVAVCVESTISRCLTRTCRRDSFELRGLAANAPSLVSYPRPPFCIQIAMCRWGQPLSSVVWLSTSGQPI
ncbi:hypothetical protein SCHPADRAFT_576784 [Schizopora paradoxa]|uniref:Uncharacterized protein n=1 Tax=Schizopora paradoxa TaxID=27342 RepID=A0A0H2RWK3_9AGAM|nr:hypothetical protein SCHPADRAFT_576784 [Schizopora paradoxa]